MRILIGQMNPTIGDLQGNSEKIITGIKIAKEQHCTIAVFPELSLTGYPPDDLLLIPSFINAVETFLKQIALSVPDMYVLVGTIRKNHASKGKSLFNSCAILKDGAILEYRDKSLLPTYDVFDELRYFEPAKENKPLVINELNVAITICEDIWGHSNEVPEMNYFHDPIAALAKTHIDLHINLSASPYSFEKNERRIKVCKKASKTLKCPTLLCNQIGGNDSLIFDGDSIFIDKKGHMRARGASFKEDFFIVDTSNLTAEIKNDNDNIADLYNALVLGVGDYFKKQRFKTACLGLSGGIDSALVACIAVQALGKENVYAFAMPSQYSSEASLVDARALADNLGIHLEVIPIETIFNEYKNLLEPFFQGKPQDVTEENLQARIRGCILMALSNKHGYIVLSTGNKSELALGYSTLYGDMCGGLSVINDVSKCCVYQLANYINRSKEIIPQQTILKEPSAELRPNQKDSDSLPDYAIIDKVLQAYVVEHLDAIDIAKQYNIDLSIVQELIIKIHRNEYKRRQSPPGLRVTDKAFSIGRRFPIVQSWVKYTHIS